MDDSSAPQVQVTSSVSVFPESKPESEPITVPLSIIDATVAEFAICAAVWYYEAPENASRPAVSHWRNSLSMTLTAYPQWCGRPFYAKVSNGGHTRRPRRIHVLYNTPTDPGVLLVTATSPQTLSDLVPSVETREKAWDASKLPAEAFIPSTPLALRPPGCTAESPPVAIQITTLACGGTAIGVALTHCLSDTQSLSVFLKDWAATSRALLSSEKAPSLNPVFAPGVLDAAAAGDIGTHTPDAILQRRARELPLHRFDWYKPVEGQPWPMNVPECVDMTQELSPSDPIPWSDWETSLPCSHRVLHFTPKEIRQIHSASKALGSNVSRHDALLAHMWTCINRARQLAPSETVYLDLTFGLRPRLSPPLPENYLGSPLMIAAIPALVSEASTASSIPYLASKIRTNLEAFTPSAIAAHLHDAAFEPYPQRLWQAFLGRKHILMTSWIRLGICEVDFGIGGRLSCVQPVLPHMDGLVEVMEACPRLAEEVEGGHWTRNGVDVNVFLEESAMGRLLDDELLWRGAE